MSERAQVARNAASAYGGRALLALSALLLTPYLYRTLGEAGFGTWSVMFTLWTILEVFEFSFASALVKYVSEYRGRGDRRAMEAALGVTLALMTALGVVAFALAGLAAVALGGLIDAPLQDDFQLGMLCLGATMLVRYPCSAYSAVLRGQQRYDLFQGAQSVLVVGSALGAVVAVELGTGVLGIAVAWSCAAIVAGLTSVLLLHRTDPGLSLRPRLATRAVRGGILRFSSLVLLAESMVFVAQRMDVVVIVALRNAAAAAPYAAAVKLQSGVQALTLPLTSFLMPMISELAARGDRHEVVRRVSLATRVSFQVTVPVAAGIALFAEELTRIWLGADRTSAIVAIVWVLMLGQIVTLATAPTLQALVGLGRVRATAALAVTEGVLNLALSVTLVALYGAVGAALGTLFTSGFLAPLRYPLFCRTAGVSTRAFLRESLGKGALGAAPGVAVMVLVWAFLEPSGARAAVGLAAGLALAAAIGVAQVGPGRLIGIARRLRAQRVDPVRPTESVEA